MGFEGNLQKRVPLALVIYNDNNTVVMLIIINFIKYLIMIINLPFHQIILKVIICTTAVKRNQQNENQRSGERQHTSAGRAEVKIHAETTNNLVISKRLGCGALG